MQKSTTPGVSATSTVVPVVWIETLGPGEAKGRAEGHKENQTLEFSALFMLLFPKASVSL